MNRSRTSWTTASIFLLLCALPLLAATPSSGTISTSATSVAWDGFPGPAVSSDQLNQTSTGDVNCTDGTNCDAYTLKLAPGDYTGKRIHFSVTWTSPVDDYDVYVHAGAGYGGPIVSKSATSPPGTIEENTFDINGVVTAGVNDTYTVHVVYFTVGPLDPYHGVLALENIPAVVVRTPKFVWDTKKTRLRFGKSRALYGNGTATGSEPSVRVDYKGNAYVGSIRGVPGGDDLWRFDLDPTSPTFDPFLNGGSYFIDPNGNITNPSYKGQPDATSPDPNLVNVGGDGGGDMDIAVGFKPSAQNPAGPPIVATTSLVVADISAQQSLDRCDTFTRNPDANITVPEDDRNWMEFYGGDTVYLAYREFAGLQVSSKFYINRSDDGGLTYGPAVLAAVGGNTTGNLAVDQGDGSVYFVFQGPGADNNKVEVAVGRPPLPGVAPLEYHTVIAAAGKSGTIAALFPCVKVAKDGTVYVAYSDGGNGIFIAHSRDQGNTWSQPVLVSDPTQSTTSLFPWLVAGDMPGSVAVTWFGANAAESEDGKGLNNDNANWRVFFAESFDATATNPTFFEAVASDHIVHAANISLGGFGGTANRNLGDFFQLALDPQGLALIAFADDSNDFSGNPYVIHQTSGFSLANGRRVDLGTDKSSTTVDPSAPQVVDGKHDAQIRTGVPTTINDDSPVDVVNIRYGCETSGTSTLVGATMQLSGLTFVPPDGIWRMHFTTNPTKPGIADRGDQWFLQAATDAQGNRSFTWGSAVRNGGGGVDYTTLGNADVGRFDTSNSSVTVKVDLAKLNGVATHGSIGNGTKLIGLRGSARAVYTVVTTPATSAAVGVVDSTRGGTSYTIGNCSSVLP
jgi:hypothetical protein